MRWLVPLVAVLAGTWVHEAGHWVAARCLGLEPRIRPGVLNAATLHEPAPTQRADTVVAVCGPVAHAAFFAAARPARSSTGGRWLTAALALARPLVPVGAADGTRVPWLRSHAAGVRRGYDVLSVALVAHVVRSREYELSPYAFLLDLHLARVRAQIASMSVELRVKRGKVL